MNLHHSFDVTLASEHSIEEAIIIHHFQHWITINRRLKKNFIEDRTWSYQSQEYIAAHFPYLDRYQVMRIIEKLVSKGILMEGNFNKLKYDKTKWYAFINEKKYLPPIDIVQKCTIESEEMHNRKCKSAQPIPDSLTDAKKDTYIPPKVPKPPEPLRKESNVRVPSNEERNRSLIAQLKRDIPEECKGLYIYNKTKLACDVSKGIDLTLLMPHDDFLRLLMQAYGLTLEE